MLWQHAARWSVAIILITFDRQQPDTIDTWLPYPKIASFLTETSCLARINYPQKNFIQIQYYHHIEPAQQYQRFFQTHQFRVNTAFTPSYSDLKNKYVQNINIILIKCAGTGSV
jgi:hypothetical protein